MKTPTKKNKAKVVKSLGYTKPYKKPPAEIVLRKSKPIDWPKIENLFYKNLTETRTLGISGDFQLTDFKDHVSPAIVFKWFKKHVK